jgi:ACS family hexuronate transporter-like MFS transporter
MSAKAEAIRFEKGPLSFGNWGPVLFMGLMSLISYLDRSTLATLSPLILNQTHLTAQQLGWIGSAFAWAYVAGNPFWGYMIDRFGIRKVLACAVGIWTVASVCHALVSTFLGFVIARSILGFAEGATFPAGLRTANDTLGGQTRSRGMAIAYSGGSLGALFTPLIVLPIANNFGWQAAFLFTGVAGLAWILAWLFWPVARVQPAAPNKTAKRASLRPLLVDRKFWASIMLYAFGALPLAFPLNWASLYLNKVMGVSLGKIATLLWLPPLGWEIGYLVTAWICDRSVNSDGQIPTGRFQWLAIGFMVLTLPLAFTAEEHSIVGVMVLLVTTMFAAGGFVVLALRYASGAFPNQSGMIAGASAGAWSALVAIINPIIGRNFDHAEYAQVYHLVAIFPIIGFVGWRLLTFRTESEARA